jgi:hypothetical protein
MGATEETKWSLLLLNDDATPVDFVVESSKMTEKICPECNGDGFVDQGTEDERRCRRATDLASIRMDTSRPSV